MDKDYSKIEGMINNTRVQMTTAFDEGYKQGFDAGMKAKEGGLNRAYNHGARDAWECARKIDSDRDVENYVFGEDLEKDYDTVSVSEAMTKIKEYEEKVKKVEVGDELENNSQKCVVTHIVSEDYVDVVYTYKNGESLDALYVGYVNPKNYKKTGRHFAEITTLLQKMKGDNNA